MALAVKHLFLERYINSMAAFTESLKLKFQHLVESPDSETCLQLEESSQFSEFHDGFEIFLGNVRAGHEGSTAQYWIQFMNFVQLYHLFKQITQL